MNRNDKVFKDVLVCVKKEAQARMKEAKQEGYELDPGCALDEASLTFNEILDDKWDSIQL